MIKLGFFKLLSFGVTDQAKSWGEIFPAALDPRIDTESNHGGHIVIESVSACNYPYTQIRVVRDNLCVML